MLPSPSDSANMSDVQVSVVLSPVNFSPELALVRSFTLSASNPIIQIGRCSKRGFKNRSPGIDNAWFDSRVMSRDHAELSIAPDIRNIYICDYGSTHGTWINNSKLITGEKTPLIHGDVLTFGVPVDREDETYPALAVKCKFEWVDEWPTSDEVPINSHEVEDIIIPASKLRPSTSTNTFCVPEDDSDVEEIPVSVSKVRFPFTRWPIRTLAHPPEPICLDEDQESVPQNVQEEQQQKEQHMDEELKSSEDEDSDYGEVLEDESDDSTHSDEEFELEASEEPSLLNKSHYRADVTADATIDANADANTTELDASRYGDLLPCYGEEQNVSQEKHYGFRPPLEVYPYAESVSDSDVLSEKGSSVDSDSYNDDDNDEEEEEEEEDDDDGVYINTNINNTPFVNPNVLLLENQPSVNAGPHVKPETIEPKTGTNPLASPHAYPFAGPSFQPSPSFLPPPPCYEANPWRMPQSFPSAPHTPYPRLSEYADGPFSCKYGSIYQRHTDSNPSTPLRELTPLPPPPKAFSSHSDSVSLKRKASEMESQGVEQQDAQEAEASILASQPDLDSIPKPELVDAIKSALSESEPAPKRAKISHSSSNAVVGYTATAVISALLGGLGTIALLAALPVEYFQ